MAMTNPAADEQDIDRAPLPLDAISIVRTEPDAAQARACLGACYATLARRFETGFEVFGSLDPDAAALRPPLGAFFLAMAGDGAVGCVALKGDGTEIGEIKRLWIAPAARSQGLARRLMARAEARALGMARLRLDTNRALTGAMALYRAAGWTEIAAFNAEPCAHHWFEKRL